MDGKEQKSMKFGSKYEHVTNISLTNWMITHFTGTYMRHEVSMS